MNFRNEIEESIYDAILKADIKKVGTILEENPDFDLNFVICHQDKLNDTTIIYHYATLLGAAIASHWKWHCENEKNMREMFLFVYSGWFL